MPSCCTIPCRPLTARTDYCTHDCLAIPDFLTTLGNFFRGFKIIIVVIIENNECPAKPIFVIICCYTLAYFHGSVTFIVRSNSRTKYHPNRYTNTPLNPTQPHNPYRTVKIWDSIQSNQWTDPPTHAMSALISSSSSSSFYLFIKQFHENMTADNTRTGPTRLAKHSQ